MPALARFAAERPASQQCFLPAVLSQLLQRLCQLPQRKIRTALGEHLQRLPGALFDIDRDLGKRSDDFPHTGFIHLVLCMGPGIGTAEIQHIQRLIRKVAEGKIIIGTGDHGGDELSGDLHLMKPGIFLTAGHQDPPGLLRIRLHQAHTLKPPLQCRIFFDMAFILLQRRRTDAAQLPAGQTGLEHAGHVDAAFRSAGSDHLMKLIDEQDRIGM